MDGYIEGRTRAPYVEILDDAQLATLNRLLPWRVYTVDSKGRRFGNRMGGGKKERPALMPDPRIVMMDDFFDLHDKHVLEVGCLEGIHTIPLCQRAARVTAVDIQLEYVVKTIVRCAFFGLHPDAFVCNVETWPDDDGLRADVIHHVGVLYHLGDPVRHLMRLGRLARVGLLLDTHIAEDDEATESMVVEGRTYRYKRYAEAPGYAMYDHAKWLLLDDIVLLLREVGFDPVTVVDRRAERNGSRVTILARSRPGNAPLTEAGEAWA